MCWSGADVWEGKCYKMTESKNYDEYLKIFGVGYILRNVITRLVPTIKLQRNGDDYTLSESTTLRSREFTFQLGKEFMEPMMGGHKVKSIITMDVGTMKHTQFTQPQSIITRTFSQQELIITLEANNVVCTQKFKAVK